MISGTVLMGLGGIWLIASVLGADATKAPSTGTIFGAALFIGGAILMAGAQ